MSNLSDLLPAGGGQNAEKFVASGTLASGQTVILQSDGTAKAISQTTISNSVGSATQAATDMGEDYSVVSIGSSKVMFLFEGTSTYVKAVVGTISGTSISFGTVFVVNSSTSESIRGVYDSINDKVVVVYGKSYGSNPGYSKVLTVSGTTITAGSEVTFSGSTNVSGISMAPVFDPDTGKIAVVYWEYGGGDPLKVSIGAVSGTSISYTPGNQFATGGRYVDAVYDTAANAFAIIYSDVSNNLRVIAATLSGTTMTFGSALDLYTGASAQNSFPSIGYDASASAFVAVYADETNNKYGTARVGTISGTTITLGSATLVSGNQSFASNRLFGVVYNSATQTTVVIWGDRPSNNILYSSIGTVSGTSISFATKYLVSNDGIQAYGAAYDASSEKIAVMVRPGANDIDGFVYTSAGTSTNLTATNFIGITAEGISNGATGSVNLLGGINEAQSGLTIASDYYVQDDGSLAAGVTSIPFDISSASYTQSFSVSSQSTDPVGLVFSPDGTSMYVVSGVYPPGAKNIFQYALTTAFDISTASLSKDFDSSGQDSQARGIQFNADGTKMFINGVTGDAYYQYSLSSAYDISTGSYDSVSFSLSSQDGNMEDVVFNADGTKFYGVGLNTSKIFQYSCSSAFNLATASYDSVSLTISSQDNSPRDLFFKPDGSKMWLLGRQNNSIYQYSLSSNFNLATASYDSISFSVSSEETSSGGLAFSANGEKFYVCGGTGDDVNQYATTQTAFVTTVLAGQAISATTINMRNLT